MKILLMNGRGCESWFRNCSLLYANVMLHMQIYANEGIFPWKPPIPVQLPLTTFVNDNNQSIRSIRLNRSIVNYPTSELNWIKLNWIEFDFRGGQRVHQRDAERRTLQGHAPQEETGPFRTQSHRTRYHYLA